MNICTFISTTERKDDAGKAINRSTSLYREAGAADKMTNFESELKKLQEMKAELWCECSVSVNSYPIIWGAMIMYQDLACYENCDIEE